MAIGRYSFGCVGVGTFGSGFMMAVFHMVGTVDNSILVLYS